MFRNLVAACFGLAIMGLAGSAKAEVFEMTFTATGFAAPAPQAIVSGSFTWEAASATAPINTSMPLSNDNLLSIALEIDGHVYTLGEIKYDPFIPGGDDLIGAGSAPRTLPSTMPDFFIRWNPATGDPVSFNYAAPPLYVLHNHFL